MTSPQTNAPHATAPPNPAQTIVRILLFVILAYMIFALAYDYLYVFKTHLAKHDELSKVIEAETARSADDRRTNGPTGPDQVQEILGFAPSVPLEDKGHYYHERYTYRRALPWLTRNIDVYYKQYEGDPHPGIHSVAHTDEDIVASEPSAPVQPATEEPGTEEPATEDADAKKTNQNAEDTTPEATTDKKTSDKKAEKAEPETEDAIPGDKDE